MAKIRGANSFSPQVRQGPTLPAAGPSTTGSYAAASSSAVVCPSAAGPSAVIVPSAAVVSTDPSVPAALTAAAASPALAAGDAEVSSSMAPAQRRYHTRVGPTPPAPSHPRPARRAPSAKRAQTSSPGESYTSRSRAPPSPPYQGIAGAPDLSLGSIIR